MVPNGFFALCDFFLSFVYRSACFWFQAETKPFASIVNLVSFLGALQATFQTVVSRVVLYGALFPIYFVNNLIFDFSLPSLDSILAMLMVSIRTPFHGDFEIGSDLFKSTDIELWRWAICGFVLFVVVWHIFYIITCLFVHNNNNNATNFSQNFKFLDCFHIFLVFWGFLERKLVSESKWLLLGLFSGPVDFQ